MTPTPSDIRAELQRLLYRELVGPAEGAGELTTIDPNQRYLLGVLGPKGSFSAEEDWEELEQGGAPESSEEGQPDPTSARPTMIPNSFGMTFSVAAEARELEIQASWGRYQTAKLPEEKGKKAWQRQAMEGSAILPLEEARHRILKLSNTRETLPDQVFVTAVVRRRKTHWIVSLFLVNGQPSPKRVTKKMLFQARLCVFHPRMAPVFEPHPSRDARPELDPIDRHELTDLEMLYRRQLEFAVGHGISVHAVTAPGDPTRAIELATAAVPHFEVPHTEAPPLSGVVLDMKQLAETEDLAAALSPLQAHYEHWITEQQARLDRGDEGLNDWQESGSQALARCREASVRIGAGIALLGRDETAARCFRFANRAMYLQRVHTLYAEARRRGKTDPFDHYDQPANHSWRPFQLAFVLLNLPGLTDLAHPERSADKAAVADLLWFPTGGGKTEAYLGLAAYTLAIRRLQGGTSGLDGEHGVAVLMRYTLRLLTLQQYQRAAALICACETIRQASLEGSHAPWGRTPFRIGLWVGATSTPNRTETAHEDLKRFRRSKSGAGGGSVAQFRNCPWCGSPIDPGVHMRTDASGRLRTFTFCGDSFGRCAFSEKKAPQEGLPVLCVDEEIYRLLPSLVIATVDKFAQMPWNGQIQMLFGRVTHHCPRHGFRSPETVDADSHPKTRELPAVTSVHVANLRPPDLIIQDELHLISGPLGTLVGLYETAVEKLASCEVDGRVVRPKLVLSTATIRRAEDQVRRLFNHGLSVFPPHGLDAGDNFFSRHKPLDQAPGRLYLGLCAPGRKIKNVMIRVYATLLRAGQTLYQQYDEAADPYMTLVGYFNSRRELGGVRRMVDDAITAQARSFKADGLRERYIDPGSSVGELTSRLRATDIPEILDNLELKFSKAGLEARRQVADRGGGGTGRRMRPYDILLATNMIQVGVDVPRLGLMVVARQPKSTAEYIQATSRVGRRAPGLVVTVFNWAHPRDLSHYERFEAYHAGFYKHVEAISVTPFSPRARDRALSAVLVSLIRQYDASLNRNGDAALLTRDHPHVRMAMETILTRAMDVGSPELKQAVEKELNRRLDYWLGQTQHKAGRARLAYSKSGDGAATSRALLLQVGREPPADRDQAMFLAQGSLRNVEAPVDLVHEGCLQLDADPPVQAMPPDGGAA